MADRNSRFLLKRSNVLGKIPTVGQLKIGELALNTAEARAYTTYTGGFSGATGVREIGWNRVSISGDTLLGKLDYTTDLSPFSGNEIPSASWVLSQLGTGATDTYVTGATVSSGGTLTLGRNDGQVVTTNLNSWSPDPGYVGIQLEEKGVGKGTGFADEGILDGIKSVILFDRSNTEKLLLSTIVTGQVDLTTDPSFIFTLYSTDIPVSTTSDTLYWEMDVRYIGAGESTNKSIDESFNGTITFTGSTTNLRQPSGIVTLNSSLINESDEIVVVLRRVPSNPSDNYSADVALSSSWWVYKEKVVPTI